MLRSRTNLHFLNNNWILEKFTTIMAALRHLDELPVNAFIRSSPIGTRSVGCALLHQYASFVMQC